MEELYRLTDDVGIPTMAELGFSEDEIPMLARIAFEDPQTIGNAREVDVAALRGHLPQRLLEGEAMSVTTQDYSMVIGGAWAESESGARFEATSPATGETLGTLPEGTREDARARSQRRTPPGATGRRCRRSSGPRRWNASPT